MGVNQTGNDRFAGDINLQGTIGNADICARSDGNDPVVAYDYHTIIDDPAVAFCHRHQTSAGKSHRLRRFFCRDLSLEQQAAGLRLIFYCIIVCRAVDEQTAGCLGIKRGTEAPVQLLAVLRPVDIVRAAGTDPDYRERLAGRADLDRLGARH